jgi:23S rRNA (adenine2503-C2)-methyltransferase
MDLTKLDSFLENQPAYRRKQITQAIWQAGVDDWQKITTLPKDWRDELASACPLTIAGEVLAGEDNKSYKATLHLFDGRFIETVLLLSGDRQTVCFDSSWLSVGVFICATGRLGFKRNLAYGKLRPKFYFLIVG